MTKVTLELDTVLELSKHPNILGMKDSGDWAETWQLIQYVGDTFRVIPAQGLLLDLLARCGLPENMEGIYAVVPELAMSIVEAVENKDNVLASRQQAKLAALLRLVLGKYPLFPACSAMLNARGIPGKFFPAPIQAMSVEELERFFNEPLIRELAGKPTPATIV
jgi:4-hydroxy-tetrahydrodipicolinate synthase